MIEVKAENLRRSRGDMPKEIHLGLGQGTYDLMARHVPLRNVRGRRGATGPFADLGIRVLCALLSGDLSEMEEAAGALARAVGHDAEGVNALRELAGNASLLSNALDREAHELRWALSEMPK